MARLRLITDSNTAPWREERINSYYMDRGDIKRVRTSSGKGVRCLLGGAVESRGAVVVGETSGGEAQRRTTHKGNSDLRLTLTSCSWVCYVLRCDW